MAEPRDDATMFTSRMQQNTIAAARLPVASRMISSTGTLQRVSSIQQEQGITLTQ